MLLQRAARVLLTVIMMGCTAFPLATRGSKTAIIKPQILESGYAGQTVINPYSSADVQHLVLELLYLPSETPVASRDLSNALLNNPVTFSNLVANKSYRVRATAYKAAGTATADIISTNDSNYWVDITTTDDDRPTLANLKVKLIDKDFNGYATSSISVTPGGYATGLESLLVPFAGNVGTLAGRTPDQDGPTAIALFYSPMGALAYNGALYIADTLNHKIRRIDLATNQVTTIAGSTQGYNDGTGGNAQFFRPGGMAIYNGGLFVADTLNHKIRRIDLATNAVTTVAGSTQGAADETGIAAQFNNPVSLAIYNGALYVADSSNNKIRRIDLATNAVTTVAGNGAYSFADGAGLSASFCSPDGLVVYNGGLYIADSSNDKIRRMDLGTNEVTTVAGSTRGYSDGTGTAAQFSCPIGLTLYENNLYITELGNDGVRRMNLGTNEVTTVAGGTLGSADGTGTAAQFQDPYDLAAYNGNLYVADTNNHLIRRIDLATTAVTRLAGATGGALNGTGSAALLRYAKGIAVYNGGLYVADNSNSSIRRVDLWTYEVTTVAGGTQGAADGIGTNAQFSSPVGLTVFNGALFIADSSNSRIRRLDLSTHEVTTVAGSTLGYADGNGTAAMFYYPQHLAVYNNGLYISEYTKSVKGTISNSRIRRLDLGTLEVTTIAGGSTNGAADGNGTSASFYAPAGLAIHNGALYVADLGNNRIRRIDLGTNEVTTAAGSTQGAADGIGTSAQFYSPQGLTVFNGTLFIADSMNARIRRFNPDTGEVTTLAGSTPGFAQGPGSTAKFYSPQGLAVDSNGNIFVSDYGGGSLGTSLIRGIY